MQSLIFFDCDSTLSQIEGIDYLAEISGTQTIVAQMTDLAMTGKNFNLEIYQKRLAHVKVDAATLAQLANAYWLAQTPGAAATIKALTKDGYHCFVLSAGLLSPIKAFATKLGINPENIYAVEFDLASNSIHDPYGLTSIDGKAHLIAKLKHKYQNRAIMIGDGANDLAATADLLIGFAGNVKRPEIMDQFDVIVQNKDLREVLNHIHEFDR